MSTSIGGFEDQALDVLDAYLASGRGPANRRGLSELDGYLAAFAVGPDTVKQNEWLSLVWGQEQPGFENLDEANTILSAIGTRFDEILRQLDRSEFAPLIEERPNRQTSAADWCRGFHDGIRLRRGSWDPLLRDDQRSSLLDPILALGRSKNGENTLGFDEAAEEETVELTTDFIRACVEAINAYWRNRERRPGSRIHGETAGPGPLRPLRV